MIRLEQVGMTYVDAAEPTLRDVDLVVPEGELCLVVGCTGSGKTTLLRTVNGLVPHFSGGLLTGRVTVAGRDTRDHPPRELADVVGSVAQDPLAGFVTEVVEDELAYGMESLGVAPHVMRARVEETLDLLGLAELRRRPLRTLSGGQRQRVAIGSVLTMHPRVLVLDEPTSALDPVAAEEVLATLQRLVHDLGLTVLLAEHRLERVVQYADRVVQVHGDGRVVSGDPAAMMAGSPVAPPVVELGRLAAWQPLPLSVRDARRAATPLRERLATAPAPVPRSRGGRSATRARLQDVVVRYPGLARAALRLDTLELGSGEVVAVMGRNGSGKSTLLATLAGVRPPDTGTVTLLDDVRGPAAPASLRGPELLRRVGLVPQDAGDLLWAESVRAECAAADADAGAEAGTALAQLGRLAPGVAGDAHPRDLSEGQRLTLALSVVLPARPMLLLLDEPTRGLDYPTKARLAAELRALATTGTAVVVATHDVELVAELADRVVVLAEGQVVSDGRTSEVVTASPGFAPQVAKILAPGPWLTVGQVAAALEAVG